MKIKRLDLKAFGPFTDQRLEFLSDDPGLHIIYGPNEAGKSSSLRGLKALLYGFPKQTSDNHIHANAQLLVGGCLERNGGEALNFLRRKKNIADLRDHDDNPLSPEALSDFLQGIDAEVFESLYAIDHETLVQGGRDLLAQKGEVGQALFSAGAGILSLRRILDELDTEAEQLFSARGTTKPLNKALAQYKVLKKSVRINSLSSLDWKTHQKRLKEAEAERSAFQKKRSQQELKRQRMERLKQAIPLLKSREIARQKLREIGNVRILQESFGEIVQKTRQGRRDKTLQHEKAKRRLKSLQQESVTIHFNQELLDHAEMITSLHQRLGEYKKGMKDRPRLEASYSSCQREARDLLERIHPDLALEEIERLRPVLLRKKRVQSLSAMHEARVLQVSESNNRLQQNIREQEEIKMQLSQHSPQQEIGPLVQSLKLAMKAGDLDEQIKANREAIEAEKKRCSDTLKRIGLWLGSLQGLSHLSLPLEETVKGFEHRFDELNENKKQIKKRIDETEAKLRQAGNRIKKMAYAGEVPTEAELAKRRKKRKEGWHLIRRAWLKGEDVRAEAAIYDAESKLPEAFEKQMVDADRLADRLRREADRVAAFTDLKAEIESLEGVLKIEGEKETALAATYNLGQEKWLHLWQKNKITPLSPREMRSWLNQIDKLRFRVDELEKKEQVLQGKRKDRAQLSQTLRSCLNNLGKESDFQGEDLAPLIMFSEALVDAIHSNHSKREQLEEKGEAARKRHRELEDTLVISKRALQEWQLQWKEALEGVPLQDRLSPAEASDILENLQACFNKLKEADDFSSRIKGIDRDTAAYETEIKAVLGRVASDLLNQALEHAVIQLHNMQKKANQALALQEKNQFETSKVKEEIRELDSDLNDKELQMQAHVRDADCKNPERLEEAISKSKAFVKWKEKLSDLETTLQRLSEGESIETLVAQAEAVQAEGLPDEIAAITREIEEILDPEVLRLSEAIGDERKSLRQMDGSAEAAEAAASAEQVLAGIGRMANQYVRLKLASTLLHEEIDRYRSEHQGPVLCIASTYFSKLTTGSFSEIRTDINDKGVVILMGLRPNGGRLPVEAMSTGTRDQLYLALRLAIVHSRLKSSEAIPFIVDDILINFDDDRSRATLAALSDLAQKNQVILFTHHRQIVNDAAKMKGLGGIYVHELV